MNDKVPVFEKFSFGMRAFAQQVGSNGMTMFAFPAYGMILGLEPVLIGLVFALMRVYDGFTDPIMGWISDNTRSRWGRRRPFIFIGAIVGGIVFSLLWLPDPSWSQLTLTIYFIVFSIFFYTSYTVMTVPGDALGWELTADYSERTKVMAWFSSIVKVTSLILPWMFAITQSKIWLSESHGLKVVGVLFGILFIVTGVMPALFCRERNLNIAFANDKITLLETLLMCLKNRCYLLVCGFTLCCLFASSVYLLFGTHLSVYFLFDGDRSRGAFFFGLVGSSTSLLGLFVVIFVTKAFSFNDKKTVALYGISLALLGWVLAIVLITPSNPWLTLIPVCLNAIGVSVFWLLIGSILADVADFDELSSGARREGALASFISFLGKLAGTISAVLGGLILSLTGFDSSVSIQSAQTLFSIKFIYIAFPIVGYTLSILLLLKYPLTRERMYAIRSELEARRG